MESRKESKEYICYSAIKDQITLLPAVKEYADENTRSKYFERIEFMIDELSISRLTGITITPSLGDLKDCYLQMLDRVKNNKCTLADLYDLIFIQSWNDETINILKQEIKAALSEQSISVSIYYRIELFITRLQNLKKLMLTAKAELKDEKSFEMRSTLEKEVLRERRILDFIDRSRLSRWIVNAIERAFSEKVSGWAEYKEAKECLFAETTKKKPSADQIYVLANIIENKKLASIDNHPLYAAAIRFETIDKAHLQSIIAFINEFKDDFSDSFKKEINQVAIETFVQQYCCEKFPDQSIQITRGPAGSLDKNYDYYQVKKDFRLVNQSWEYIEKLAEFPLKNLYRIVAILKYIEEDFDNSTLCDLFCYMWKDEVSMLLGKDLKCEAKVAVVEAALDCLQHHSSHQLQQRFFKDFIRQDDAHPLLLLDDVRKNILKELNRKQSQYLREMSQYDREEARILLLRLITVHYIRNKIVSGAKLVSGQVTAEIISQFGDDVVVTRGCLPSFISKLLRKLNIPATSAQGLFASKDNITQITNRQEFKEELKSPGL